MCYAAITFNGLANGYAKDIINYSWYKPERIQLTYDKYYQDLLELVLEISKDQYGEYELNLVSAGVSQDHMVELARREKLINLMWTMTSKEREQKLIPIRIPLLKGLGGCRIALINKADQARFSALADEKALSQLVAGQGAMWPDTEILRYNHFQVATSVDQFSLLPMLTKHRFDYYPRALHEAITEAKQHSELAIEQRFLFYYDSPFFFFVSKQNPRIADRIEYGLNKAIADGTFEQFFNNHPVTSGVIAAAKIPQRQLIYLDNPLLTAETKQAVANYGSNAICMSNKTKDLALKTANK